MRTSIGDAASPALRLVLLGDASALGVGVDRVADTVGGHLAELLAGGPATNRRGIDLSSAAVAAAPGVAPPTPGARPPPGERPHGGAIPLPDPHAARVRPSAPAS